MKMAIWLVVIVAVFALLAALPAIEIDKDAVVSSTAWSWIVAGCYFIPTGTVVTIAGLILALWLFRVTVALVKTLWDLLPVG